MQFPGRAEFIRIILEDAGVPYIQKMDMKTTWLTFKEKKIDFGGYPLQFPPVIRRGKLVLARRRKKISHSFLYTNIGDFQLCQTATISRFLGQKYGLWPAGESDIWHADMIANTVFDYFAEGE